MPNIYDGTFLRKWLRARSFNSFRKKNSIKYVCEGSNYYYASLAVSFSCTVNKVHEDTGVLRALRPATLLERDSNISAFL